jgi:uncharacterized repeat protein (TIGR03803 family)
MVSLMNAFARRALGICASLLLVGCGGAPIGAPATLSPDRTTAGLVRGETVLHSFGGDDGAGPLDGMIAGKNGELYGTTAFGGGGFGTIFELEPSASGYTEKLLYSFKGGSDGALPEGIVLRNGIFYGVTFVGGDPNGNGGEGWGTIFALARRKAAYVESVLYRFKGQPDAWEPNGPIVLDERGVIYGDGLGGSSGHGAIFKVAPSGSGYIEHVLHSFAGGVDGNEPQAGMSIDARGTMYGTTMYGGTYSGRCQDGGCGIVFKLTPLRSGYTESPIYAFHESDGNLPYGAVTPDVASSAIYGTTFWGGAAHVGVAFELTPHGATYRERVLHSFTGKGDGFLPQGTISMASSGTLYGTAALGGGGCHGIGCGTVYALSRDRQGYRFHVLLHFARPSNGAEPEHTNLLIDESGAIYGTTRAGGSANGCSDGGPGGASGCGVAFKITPAFP